MQQLSTMNLQHSFRQLVSSITLQDTEKFLNQRILHSLKIQNPDQNELMPLSKQDAYIFQRQSTLMAECQTDDCLIYAFCFVEDSKSTTTLQMFKKRNGVSLQKKLKTLNVQISVLKFKFNKYNQLQMIAGSQCGRLFIYKNFQNLQITVSSIRISACKVVDIVSPSYQNLIFALASNGFIHAVNIKDNVAKYQFQCPLPHIKDQNLKLIIDTFQRYICCSFSSGRIIVWQISQKIKQQFINTEGQQQQQEVNQQRKFIQKKMCKKHYNQELQKNIIFKPKVNLLSCCIQGILWVDFFQNFLILITRNGVLKVLVINISIHNQNQELYNVISQKQIANSGKQNLNYITQDIVHIQKLKESKYLFIAKNIYKRQQKMFSTQCFLQKYQFDQQLEIHKINIIKLPFSCPLIDFKLNKSNQFLFCRTKKYFSIILKDQHIDNRYF